MLQRTQTSVKHLSLPDWQNRKFFLQCLRTLIISFCTVQLRTLCATHSLATLYLFSTSGPDSGELPGFWGSMVFRHAPIPQKGSSNNNNNIPLSSTSLFRLASLLALCDGLNLSFFDRRACVAFQNHRSYSLQVRQSVLQGSVLGPALSTSLPTSVTCSLYADDFFF